MVTFGVDAGRQFGTELMMSERGDLLPLFSAEHRVNRHPMLKQTTMRTSQSPSSEQLPSNEFRHSIPRRDSIHLQQLRPPNLPCWNL